VGQNKWDLLSPSLRAGWPARRRPRGARACLGAVALRHPGRCAGSRRKDLKRQHARSCASMGGARAACTTRRS